jgi:hypothetical protein
MTGCIGYGSPGCGHIESYSFHMRDREQPNVVARLAIELSLRGSSMFEAIKSEFNDNWKGDTWKQGSFEFKNGLDVWKHLILTYLAKAPTWHMCPFCDTYYKTKKIGFGDMIFLPLNVPTCRKHKELTEPCKVS